MPPGSGRGRQVFRPVAGINGAMVSGGTPKATEPARTMRGRNSQLCPGTFRKVPGERAAFPRSSSSPFIWHRLSATRSPFAARRCATLNAAPESGPTPATETSSSTSLTRPQLSARSLNPRSPCRVSRPKGDVSSQWMRLDRDCGASRDLAVCWTSPVTGVPVGDLANSFFKMAPPEA